MSTIVRQMKDLESGGWWPKVGSVGRWTLRVTWSDWQFVVGVEYSNDPGAGSISGAKWISLNLGRLSLTWAKDDPE